VGEREERKKEGDEGERRRERKVGRKRGSNGEVALTDKWV